MMVPMRILSRREVESLLDLDRLIDALAEAMTDLSAGRASMPPRTAAMVPERGSLLGVMPAYLPSKGALVTKLVSLFPGNAGTTIPTHQAVIAVFDPETGSPVALMDGTAITAIRTAAGSALATRLLARSVPTALAIVGAGVQAGTHARLIPRVRTVTEIRVAGRSPARAETLAARLGDELPIPVRICPSAEEAVEGAGIVCLATHAEEPVIRRAWLAPGAHVNSVGLNPNGREIDADTVRDSAVFVESRASALAPFPAGANDLTWPIRDGVITEDHIRAEIGEVAGGERPGRTGDEELTLYKSVGVAVQDAAAAALVLKEATARGIGVEVEL